MGSEQIQYIGVDRIKAEQQVRKSFDPEVLAMMCKSFQEVGQLQAIRVRRVGEHFVIVDGELRFRAGKMAGFSTMAVVIEEKELSDGELVHRQLIANCARSDLNPIEKGKAIESLMKATGWNATQTAARLGFSNATVSRLVSLLTLPAKTQGQIISGELPMSSACEIARVEDAGRQATLIDQVTKNQVTRDAISGQIKARKNAAQQAGSPAPSRITARLPGNRTVVISSPALTLDGVVTLIDELRTRARASIAKGHSVDTFTKLLSDEAKRAS